MMCQCSLTVTTWHLGTSVDYGEILILGKLLVCGQQYIINFAVKHIFLFKSNFYLKHDAFHSDSSVSEKNLVEKNYKIFNLTL